MSTAWGETSGVQGLVFGTARVSRTHAPSRLLADPSAPAQRRGHIGRNQ